MTEVASAGRRERKKEETKRKIFEAALELFAEKGFEATTIDDITLRADVAKGTFFNYFPRREAIIEYLGEEWISAVEEAVDPKLPAGERVIALYAAAADNYHANPVLARHVVKAALERFCCPDPGGAWTHFEELVVGAVREGIETGEFRKDIPGHAIYGVLGSCFIGSLVWWLGPREQHEDPKLREIPLPDVVRLLQRTALEGIKARVA